MEGQQTLCWSCRRSYTGGCSWADDFEPVEGWQAAPQLIKTHAGYDPDMTYFVTSCPLFKDECPEGSTHRTYYAKPIPDITGAQRLAAAIVAEAAKDLATWLKVEDWGKVREVEQWLRSDRAGAIMEYDPDKLIKAIRQRVSSDKKIRKNGAL